MRVHGHLPSRRRLSPSRGNTSKGRDTVLAKACCVVLPMIYFGCLLFQECSEKVKTAVSSKPVSPTSLFTTNAPPKDSLGLTCPQFEPSSPELQNSPLSPIWVPGYPGSGSELFRDLMQAWTGMPALDVYSHGYCQGAVTCKTHWPAFDHQRIPAQLQQQAPQYKFHNTTAFLLLRHPAAAIPSYRNFLYEVNHGLKDHSRQAPQPAWLEWRDRRFDRDMDRWARVIRTWYTEHGDNNNNNNNNNNKIRSSSNDQSDKDESAAPVKISLLIPYEAMTDPVQGPKLVDEIRQQLQKAGHVMDDDDDDGNTTSQRRSSHAMHCTWRRHVHERPAKKRGGKTYQPGFTVAQYQTMHATLVALQQEFSHEATLCTWLQHYQQQVEDESRMATFSTTS